MPEAPEIQEHLEVTVAEPDVPMNQGEKERFGATLNLEDKRRRESFLQEQLKTMGGTAAGEVQSRFARSPAARKRQQAVLRKIQELKNLTRQAGDRWEGPCAPATIINLNPITLQLFGGLQRYSVAAAGKGLKVELVFRGRKFTGSYVTIATPEVWLKHTGIELDPIADTPQMEAQYIPPIGLAHQFYSHYCVGAPDAQHIGGVLIFEGNIHTLQKASRTKGSVRVPRADWSPDVPGEVIYSVEERLLEEYLAEELTRQKNYAELVIAQGHSYATSQNEIDRNNKNNNHVLWHNYALEHKYIPQAYPWASSILTDGPLVEHVFCPDCRTQQEDPAQYFCRNCNAPFDAHKAFMAGKQVSPDRLALYEESSKEFKEILGELERRKRRLALLDMSGEAKEAKKPKEPKA